MIEMLSAPEHVVAFRASGKLNSDDYDRLFEALNARLKRYQHVGLFVEVVELTGITPAALAKDLRYTFARVGEFERFSRAAVVTDKKWLRALARVSDGALSRTQIRTFEPHEREAAFAWVVEVRDEFHEPALRAITTTRADTYGFVWNGRISTEDMTDFVNTIRPAADSCPKLRLLGRLDHVGGVVPGVFTESGLLSLKHALSEKLERYAIVGGPTWLSRNIGLIRKLTKVDVRHFESSAEQEAWAWLEARPVEFQATESSALN